MAPTCGAAGASLTALQRDSLRSPEGTGARELCWRDSCTASAAAAAPLLLQSAASAPPRGSRCGRRCDCGWAWPCCGAAPSPWLWLRPCAARFPAAHAWCDVL
jgi:hypothetical protein